MSGRKSVIVSGGKFESVSSNCCLSKLLSVRDVVGKLISGDVSLNPKSDPSQTAKYISGSKFKGLKLNVERPNSIMFLVRKNLISKN